MAYMFAFSQPAVEVMLPVMPNAAAAPGFADTIASRPESFLNAG